jgi:hypothetical protein
MKTNASQWKTALALTVAARCLRADAAATEAAGLAARVIEHPMLVRQISLIESASRSLSPAAQHLVSAVRSSCEVPA